MNHPVVRLAPVCAGALLALLLQASCAGSVYDDISPPPFVSGDAGVAPLNVCVDTECPAPYATCPGERGLCTVDLRKDVDHCGSCETACPRESASIHGSYVCSDGQCVIACAPLFADCNKDAADGCETSTANDPANCGFCGNKCNDGDICWKGACGCPNGFTLCGDDCKKLDSDDDNCSACGNLCRAPASADDPRWSCGPGVMPSNTKWTCASSSCDILCKPGFGNCNQNLCGDGCETNLRSDPENCGECGHKCESWQACRQGTCVCPPGTTECDGECVDLGTDPWNCGACGNWCGGAETATGSPSCEAGKCTYTCFPGFANCDGRLDNGCEANLQTDQKHCGSCTTSCNVAAGQPCVEGKCLTKECPEVIVR